MVKSYVALLYFLQKKSRHGAGILRHLNFKGLSDNTLSQHSVGNLTEACNIGT